MILYPSGFLSFSSCVVSMWLASIRVPSHLWRGAPMGWNCSLEMIRDVWFSRLWTWTRWNHWMNECMDAFWLVKRFTRVDLFAEVVEREDLAATGVFVFLSRVCVTPCCCWKSLQVWFRWNTVTRCCWCPLSKGHCFTALKKRRASSWAPNLARGKCLQSQKVRPGLLVWAARLCWLAWRLKQTLSDWEASALVLASLLCCSWVSFLCFVHCGIVRWRPRSFLVLCSSGRFGACFLPGLCKQSDLEVFAARPGLQLWRSNIRGQVEDTRLLKSLFKTQVDWECLRMLTKVIQTSQTTDIKTRKHFRFDFFWPKQSYIRTVKL